jgi:hypothetical protein
MEIYAEEAGLSRRLIIPVPLLTPRLSSYWIHLVTPLPSALARPLVEGLRTPVLCRDNRIRDLIPQDLISCRLAIRLALGRLRQDRVETCWHDAGRIQAPEWTQCGDAPYAGGAIPECGYRAVISGGPRDLWEAVERIGGRSGWYFADLLWRVRGAMDRLAGGVGLRRGRRHSHRLAVGDAVDFWRVLDVCAPTRLILLAEMKMPGEAILEIRLHSLSGRRTEATLRARFRPRGLLGLAYWYALIPAHEWVYRGMLERLAALAGRAVLQGPERFAPRRHFVCEAGPDPWEPDPDPTDPGPQGQPDAAGRRRA